MLWFSTGNPRTIGALTLADAALWRGPREIRFVPARSFACLHRALSWTRPTPNVPESFFVMATTRGNPELRKSPTVKFFTLKHAVSRPQSVNRGTVTTHCPILVPVSKANISEKAYLAGFCVAAFYDTRFWLEQVSQFYD